MKLHGLSLKRGVKNNENRRYVFIKTRAQDDYYMKLVTDFIKKFGKASRKDIDKLLNGKLSDTLDIEQKNKKIGNLLTKMRRSKMILNKGSRTSPEWIIAESFAERKV